MIDKKQPIIIKKVYQGEHGHHGGAWKVAFADFVTAMMAFFLLMWLMGSTTKEERAAISEYFNNPSAAPGTTATPAPSGLQGPGGASTSMIKLGGTMDLTRPQPVKERVVEKEVEKEKKRLEELMEKMKKAIEESQALKPFKDQLLLDITPEGLRIQIVDKENRPMFDSGSAVLKDYTREILGELAKFISEVPNRISISGHTDATPFQRADGYSNWELSADRANAARRTLVDAGLAESKVGRVVGLSSSVLFDKANPTNPVNRRISIIVMNKQAEEDITRQEAEPEFAVKERQNIDLDAPEANRNYTLEPAPPPPALETIPEETPPKPLKGVDLDQIPEPAPTQEKPAEKPATESKPLGVELTDEL